MLKLFAFDLDQTLLVHGSIREKNREALRALQAEGKTIAFVTGRVLRSPQFLAAQAGITAYCVGSNGSVTATPNGHVLSEHKLDPQTAVKLIQIGLRHHVYFHFYSQDTLFSPYFYPERYEHLLAADTTYGMRMQCNIHIQKHNDLEKGADQMLKIQYSAGDDLDLQNALMREIRAIGTVAVTMSGKGLVEAMAQGVDKWHGLKVVADHCGIQPEEICAMGDYLNDCGMISHAGVGVAMGNALSEVKEAADMVTGPFDAYGAAEAVWRLKEEGRW